MVPVFGPSVWNANVAVVQATETLLERLAQREADRDNAVYVDPDLIADASAPAVAVDLEFQQALESSVINL
jgi:hypothetical protein